MSTPTPEEMTLDAIRSVPLFAPLDDHAATELRDLLSVRATLLQAILCFAPATTATPCI